MPTCETCGNDNDKAVQVSMNGQAQTFDSFECAIHALAPTCTRCGTRIMGHGLEQKGVFYCCDHCASKTVYPIRTGFDEVKARPSATKAISSPETRNHSSCFR